MKPAPKHTTHNKLLNSISYIYHIYIDMCVCVENIYVYTLANWKVQF